MRAIHASPRGFLRARCRTVRIALRHTPGSATPSSVPSDGRLQARGQMADLLERLQRALADRYRIERELGRGGMATVFLAEDLKHRRRLAIKVLDPEAATA